VDEDGAREFLEHPKHREVSALLASLTRGGRTAQIQHRMKSG